MLAEKIEALFEALFEALAEVLEDIALVNAIREGETSELVGRDEVWTALGLRNMQSDWDNSADAAYDNWQEIYGRLMT